MLAKRNSAVVTLPSDTQVLIERTFDAPRRLVFRAWTTPDLVKRWWSGERGEVTVAEIDLRVGGAWRYAMLAHGKFEVGFHGVYQEIEPDALLVTTEVFEGAPDAGAVTRASFIEADGRTTVSILVTHQTKVNRDAHVNSGMEGGMQESMNKLEGVVADLAGERLAAA